MKQHSVLFLACALAIPAVAQDVTTTNSPAVAAAHAPGQMFLASAATMTAPLVFTNDYFHLESDMADVAAGRCGSVAVDTKEATRALAEALRSISRASSSVPTRWNA